MATNSAGNTGAKPKGKPRGKPFAKGSTPANAFVSGDPRANRHGQRNAQAVSSAAQAREIYIALLAEPVGTVPGADASQLELICRRHVAAAVAGDPAERERLFDRIFGRAVSGLDIDLQANVRAIPVTEFTDEELMRAVALGDDE